MINYNYHECQVENVQLKTEILLDLRCQTSMISFKSLSESCSGASIAILIRHERLHCFMCCGGPHCLPVFPLTLLAAAPPPLFLKYGKFTPPPPPFAKFLHTALDSSHHLLCVDMGDFDHQIPHS